MKLRLFYLVAQKSIVGGALHAESVERHALAASHQYGVRTAHVLLAKRIAHIGTVDAALALYTCIAHAYSEHHRLRPLRVGSRVVIDRALTALIAREVKRSLQRGVGVYVLHAFQHSALLKKERHTRLQIDRARAVLAARHHHTAPTLLCTMLYGVVYRLGVVHRLVVAHCTKRRNAHHNR